MNLTPFLAYGRDDFWDGGLNRIHAKRNVCIRCFLLRRGDAVTTITATELARHTREILDQVISQGATVAVERNRRVVAEIIPARPTVTVRQLFAELRATLSSEQAQDWLDDSRRGFDEALRDPWA